MAKKRKSKSVQTIARGRTQSIGGIEKYEVINAADTLIRAEEIKADRKMMKATGIELHRRQRALSKVVSKK